MEEFLDHAPKELNEVQFTMELQQEQTQMAGCFNGFLNKRLLFSKVRLLFENLLVAASILIGLACLLTFPTKLGLPETTLHKYSLDTLGVLGGSG